MDISAMTNSMSSWKVPAITYLDIWSERSSRNLIATRIIRSALKSFYRYVDKFPPLFQSFSHRESVFVSSKSTSSPWIWPLCYSTTKPHTHIRTEGMWKWGQQSGVSSSILFQQWRESSRWGRVLIHRGSFWYRSVRLDKKTYWDSILCCCSNVLFQWLI